VRCSVDGGVISVKATPTTSIGSLVKDSKSRLALLKDTPDDLIVARKAIVDEDEKVISVEARILPASGKLRALNISGDSHIVLELRAHPAAATGGAAASSGEWRGVAPAMALSLGSLTSRASPPRAARLRCSFAGPAAAAAGATAGTGLKAGIGAPTLGECRLGPHAAGDRQA